ncbi:unnamed protein product [Cladocopium goreaui]|uniref:Fido domain-containing protein n=1 Tax=Cladocopium goreaui TaxID=2562237 RepID=A0A9P1GS72_9DINO|nr:unnamed protein product [Cladocopium goreaui]
MFRLPALALGAFCVSGLSDLEIAERIKAVNAVLKCETREWDHLPGASHGDFTWGKLNAALRYAHKPSGDLEDVLNLSRAAFDLMEPKAVEKIRWVEVRLMAPDRRSKETQARFLQLYLAELERYGLEKKQLDRVENSLLDPGELKGQLTDFCIFPYLAAVIFLVKHDAGERQKYLDHLCQLLDAGGIHWIVLLLWAHVRLMSPSEAIRTLEEHGVMKCSLQMVPRPRPPKAAPSFEASTLRSGRALRVVLWSGHGFAWDSLMASHEAAVQEGMKWQGLILGFALAEKHKVARENCQKIGIHLGTDALCQHSRTLGPLLELVAGEGLGTETGLSVHQAKRMLDAARAEFPMLKMADLVICSYPYVLCPFLGTYEGFKDTAMLTVVKGAGSMAEYAHASLVPWILGIYKRWMTATDSGVGTPRKVVCADAIDPAIVQATFGDHVSPQLVDFGARYVLHLAGGVQCDLRAKTKTLLVWRLFSIFPGLDAMAMNTILSGFQNAPPPPWKVELMQDTIEFTYKDLQDASAILQVPWDWALVSFMEFLALGIPLILPNRDYMHSLITTVYWSRLANRSVWSLSWKRRFLQLVPEDWEAFELGASNKSLKMTETTNYAHGGSMLDHVAYWWQHTEYAKQRMVKTFDSLSHLYTVLNHLDPKIICERLHWQTRRKLRRSREFHRRFLREVWP